MYCIIFPDHTVDNDTLDSDNDINDSNYDNDNNVRNNGNDGNHDNDNDDNDNNDHNNDSGDQKIMIFQTIFFEEPLLVENLSFWHLLI